MDLPTLGTLIEKWPACFVRPKPRSGLESARFEIDGWSERRS
jgi:hypothetical protein